MYSNSAAQIRPDLQAVIEQAMHADAKFIGATVLPAKFSKRKAGEYHFINLSSGELLAAELGDATLRSSKSAYREVDRTYEKRSFVCADRGLIEVVDDSDAADVAPSFQMESSAGKLLMRNMNISYEKRVSKTMFDENVFKVVNPIADYTQANIATMDVAADVEAMLDAVSARGELPNTIIIPRRIWSLIRRSDLLGKYIFGNLASGKQITRKNFEEAFSDSYPIKVLIPEATYSTAPKGKLVDDAKHIKYIWEPTHIWAGCLSDGEDRAAPEVTSETAAPAIVSEGVGRTIIWEEQASSLFVTETYRNEHLRSDVIRNRQFSVEHIFNPNCGQLLRTKKA